MKKFVSIIMILVMTLSLATASAAQVTLGGTNPTANNGSTEGMQVYLANNGRIPASLDGNVEMNFIETTANASTIAGIGEARFSGEVLRYHGSFVLPGAVTEVAVTVEIVNPHYADKTATELMQLACIEIFQNVEDTDPFAATYAAVGSTSSERLVAKVILPNGDWFGLYTPAQDCPWKEVLDSDTDYLVLDAGSKKSSNPPPAAGGNTGNGGNGGNGNGGNGNGGNGNGGNGNGGNGGSGAKPNPEHQDIIDVPCT